MTSEEIFNLDRQYLWHPFTQMQDWASTNPIAIVSGDGVRVRDSEGREYFDANSSLWVTVHGHCRREIDEAIAAQLGKIAHSTMLGLTHEPAARLAQKLVEIAPKGLSRVFYSDSGSTAVEIAIKMAYQTWQHRGHKNKTKCIALAEGYHGDTLGSVSVGGIGLFHGIFRPLLFTAEFAPSPSRFQSVDDAVSGIEEILKGNPGEVFAVIMEPLVQAAGGMLIAPEGTLSRVRDLCNRYDALLIVDEVATGFGRTGTMFACEQESVCPDLMTVAKGLTGGYLPLAATLATEEVYSAFLGNSADLKTFYHGHSYTGNPLACAAALANLQIFADDNVIPGLAPKIDFVRQRMSEISQNPHVGPVRQCGLMIGIPLYKNADTAEEYDWTARMGALVCDRARALGLITRPLLDVVIFVPPLSSTRDELAAMMDIIEQAIVDITQLDYDHESRYAQRVKSAL